MAADKKTLLRDALKQVQGGRIDKAIETYKAIVKADPRDATVHNTLGDLYAKQGRKKEAIGEWNEASTLQEKDGFALRSIAILQKVINLDPDQLSVRLKLGDLYASQRLAADARKYYLEVADVYDKKKDVNGALEIFRKIANLDPDNLPVRVKLAGMFEKQKFPDKAAEEYVRAAKGYLDRKEMESAVQLYVRAFKLSPGNIEARRRLADYYAQRQDWPVVVGLLETPVAKGSSDVDLVVLYADALTRVNHAREAAKVLEAAQRRDPNSVPVNLALGRAALKAGDAEKGIAALNRCVSVHLSENRFEPAEALLAEMAAASPGDDKIHQRILEVAQKRGDKGAIAKAYLQLAGVYEKKGLVRSATGALEKYLEINPGDSAAVKRLESLKAEAPAPKPEAPPKVEAAAAKPEAPAARPEPAATAAPAPPGKKEELAPSDDEVVEIDLEGEDLTEVMTAGEEELEVEGDAVAAQAPLLAPESVADALIMIRQGAANLASEFLEERLGQDPGDVEAWSALVDARRHLGDRHGVRDALLRLAALHRREARFDEAHAAYRAALDADPRSAAAARGLAELLLEEEAASAPAPPPSPKPAPAPAPPPPEPEPEPEAEAELELDLEAELEPEPETLEAAEEDISLDLAEEEAEPQSIEASAEPAGLTEPEPVAAAPEGAPEPEAQPAPEPLVEELDLEPAEEPVAVEPAAADSGQFMGFDDLLEPAAAPAAAPAPAPAGAEGAAPPPEPEFEELSLEGFGEERGGVSTREIQEPPSAPVPPPVEGAAPPPPAVPAPSPALGQEFEEFLAEADFYFQQGLVDEAEFLYKKLLQLSPGHPDVSRKLQKLEESREPVPAAAASGGLESLDEELDLAFGEEAGTPAAAAALPEPAPPGVGAPGSSSAADFSNFLDDLRQELTSHEPPAPPAALQGEEGLSEIFQEFQRSVKEQLGDEDFETHYNLGIAYKEMGLMDEAVAEFSLAEKSPVRQLNAVSMIALCLREAGRIEEAAQKLRTGISLAPEGSEEQKGFLYDLAALHEQAGRPADAQETLRRLLEIDPGYRDVAARVVAAPAAPPAPGAGASPRKKPKVSYL